MTLPYVIPAQAKIHITYWYNITLMYSHCNDNNILKPYHGKIYSMKYFF